jgi:hypothetical protein
MAVGTALLVLGVLLGGRGIAHAQEVRFSGHVVGVDPGGGAILVVEMTGGGTGRPPARQRALVVGGDAKLFVVERTRDAVTGWPGDYRQRPATPLDIRPGDFVTVTAARRAGMWHALSISISRGEEAR